MKFNMGDTITFMFNGKKITAKVYDINPELNGKLEKGYIMLLSYQLGGSWFKLFSKKWLNKNAISRRTNEHKK